MSDSLNAVTAPDTYNTSVLLQGKLYNRFVVDVANQAIYWQLQIPVSSNTGNWENIETYMLPGSRVINENAVGIRIRAAIPAAQLPTGSNQAIVTVRAIDTL